MAASELARLTRRVDKHDEDIRTLGDLIVDIKETVDHHTEVLDRHTETLDRHTGMLTEILERLGRGAG